MRFIDIPKFVINLEKRPERLTEITQEMEWMGWDFEVFNAIDTNSYMGITLSHIEIFKICEERGYDRVMVIEDDSIFMPNSKELINKIDEFIFDFDLINLSPTLNRPVNLHSNNFYTQTYNWNLYSPVKIPSEYMDYNNNQILKYES